MPTLPQRPRKEIRVGVFFLIIFSAARSARPAHTLLRHKSDSSQPRRKQKWVFLGVFTSSPVKPGVPKRGVEAAKPQTSPQDPAQVFAESISGMVGMGSILELSPVLQHPIVEVNHQQQWLYSRSCTALYRALQLVGAIIKSQVRCKADFFLRGPGPSTDEMTFNNAKHSRRGPVSAPNRYKKACEVLGCHERLSALQTMIERVEICFVCFSLTPGLQSRKMRTSCTHVN